MVRVVSFDVGIVNMAYCVGDICPDGGRPQIRACKVFKIGEMMDTLAVLLRSIVQILHNTPDVNDGIEDILVEQQLSLKASRNTSIASAVIAYYEALKAQGHSTLKRIRFVNPRSKFKALRLCGLDCIEPFRDELKSAKGKALKKLSVNMAILLAEHWHLQVFLDAMKSTKKHDDIADCALYTLCSQM
jgi:hypothetical protein